MTYHGIIKWRFDSEPEHLTHHSSFQIERPDGWSYAMTLTQFRNDFVKKVAELLGDEPIYIYYIDMKTGDKITII